MSMSMSCISRAMEEADVKYFYKEGELQYYLYQNVCYAAQYPLYWAVFQYENGGMLEVGPAHCAQCIINCSVGGVVVGPCEKCACHYNYELGPGFDKFRKERTGVIDEDGQMVLSAFEMHLKGVDLNNIGHHYTFDEPVQLDESLELECTELRDQLYEIHGDSKVDREGIEGLMQFIRSFTNPDEMRKKINTALLIQYSQIYNRNWAETEWDWFTGQLNKNEGNEWMFTNEECESIRISQETIRNMVADTR